jgi:predicted dinucleotide-binding enzyme
VASELIEQLGYVAINLGTLAAGGALYVFPGGLFAARTCVELNPNG